MLHDPRSLCPPPGETNHVPLANRKLAMVSRYLGLFFCLRVCQENCEAPEAAVFSGPHPFVERFKLRRDLVPESEGKRMTFLAQQYPEEIAALKSDDSRQWHSWGKGSHTGCSFNTRKGVKTLVGKLRRDRMIFYGVFDGVYPPGTPLRPANERCAMAAESELVLLSQALCPSPYAGQFAIRSLGSSRDPHPV